MSDHSSRRHGRKVRCPENKRREISVQFAGDRRGRAQALNRHIEKRLAQGGHAKIHPPYGHVGARKPQIYGKPASNSIAQCIPGAFIADKVCVHRVFLLVHGTDCELSSRTA